MVRNLPRARHHVRVSYFTAVIASDGSGWRARDVDVTDAGSLDDLAEVMRLASVRDRPVLAVIEREDEWFALVRVDGDDDPRLFVSDMVAAGRSKFADMLAPATEVEVTLDDASGNGLPVAAGTGATPAASGAVLGSPSDPVAEAEADAAHDAAEEGDEQDAAVPAEDDASDLEDEDLEDEETGDVEPPGLAPWAGDPRLLEDMGLEARRLAAMAEESPDPAEVIGEVGEACGFADLLEALR
jgi:putative tRNA adenosine deaminase-associated protein